MQRTFGRVTDMAYMKGVDPADASWFTRLAYWFVRRKFGKLTGKDRLIEPVKIAAHHPRLLRAIGQMEAGIGAAHTVPVGLTRLASLQASMLIGCPF
jgi:4-carboxymuconolactone decarboxylase